MEPILNIEGLTKTYGSVPNQTKALNGITFQVMPGEFLGIMGSSGSGKSTLLNCIATVTPPSGGSIMMAGTKLNALKGKALAEYRGRKVGYLFQNFELLDNLTGRENILLPTSLHSVPEKESRTRLKNLSEYLEITDVLDNATNFEDFSDRLMQQYGIAVKESRGQLSYLPAGRTKFIRAKHLGDKFDKAAVLATLQANAERKPKAQFKQDTIGKLIDIQSRMTEGKGIGYKRWLTKHNLKVMAQTVKLLQEKDLTDEDALNQRITELETKYHDSLAVVKDLEGRMKFNKELRYHVAAYASTKNIEQQLKSAKRPAAFEEQHRAELTAYRAAAAYFKANNITKLPSPKKLEAEYAQLASEKAKFYEQYKEAKEELLKLKTAKQNVASFFREEEPAQQER